MVPVTCRFCNQLAEYKPLPQMEEHGAKIFFCFNCNAEYTLWNDTLNKYYSLYVTINDKTYRWSIDEHNSYLYRVKIPGKPGVEPNKKMEMIKSFNRVCEINPSNIERRTKIILLIS